MSDKLACECSEPADLQDKLIGLTEVNAPTPLSNAVRDQKLSPQVGTRNFVPRDGQIEGQLITVEKLIRRRSYNAAIRVAGAIKLDDANLASTYALMVNEKISRSQVALGDRYLAKGDLEQAKNSYNLAVNASADLSVKAVSELTKTAAADLLKNRAAIIDSIKGMIIKGDYEKWCETRTGLGNLSILDHLHGIIPDIRLEDALGPRIPPNWPSKQNPGKGWIDPVAIDDLANDSSLGSQVLDRPALIPGASFAASSEKPVGLDAIQAFAATQQAPGVFAAVPLQLMASSSLPLMASMLTAHARLQAVEFKLSPFGQSAGSLPIYRYAYLIAQADKILGFIADLDAKMITLQLKLDDFLELIDTIRRHIDENSAELQALNTRIADLQTTIVTLTKGNEDIGKVVLQLNQAVADCDPEWWEYLVSVLVVIAATAVGAVVGFLIGGIPGALAGGLVALINSIGLTIKVWSDRAITCENVNQARDDFSSAQSALQAALSDNKAELNYALLQRDQVLVALASLQDAYDEAVSSNQARVLNATTISHIMGVLDNVRSSSIYRAHALARMAQEAYNAEHDTQVNMIAASHSDYLDKDARGYTSAAVLKQDLTGLEHIRLTGRTRKHMQLTQIVSLSKHYPSAYGSLLITGQARFATRLTDFDRWFPGTYMQNLKEVRVEILVDDQAQPIRGYLSNDGVSFVRFSDYGNKVKVDGRDVLDDPDADIRKLCYKRRRRHHAVETMAFPGFDSFMFEARAKTEQQQERNFFEGCGLESTWNLELMPDQQLDYARISDVRVYFQFEAFLDSALKAVVEAKRYKDRNETALVSVRKLLERQGAPVDFSQALAVDVSAFLFEAPNIEKTIRDIGLILRPKQLPLLTGKAKLHLNYQGQTAIDVETNDQGIVATADTKPAGTNTAALRALTQGKSVVGPWLIELVELPVGFNAGDIDDVLLMIPYTFKPV